MIPVGRRDLGVLMGGKNQQPSGGGKSLLRSSAQLSPKDVAVKPIGRPVMASNRPRSLAIEIRKQQHMKMKAGMSTSHSEMTLNSRRHRQQLAGYKTTTSPVTKSCGVSTGSLPMNSDAQIGSLRKFQRQLVDRFRRSFHVDAKNNDSVKMGNPTGVTTS